MSIRVSVLSSGSGGNATFIRTDKVRMLIDCGLGPKTLANRLRTIGEDPDQIDVVLITHEHTDHGSYTRSRFIRLHHTCYEKAPAPTG